MCVMRPLFNGLSVQRDDGKGMEGEAGYLTGINNETLRPMIEITKGVETGYGSILAISDMESAMRDERIKNENRLHVLRRRLQL